MNVLSTLAMDRASYCNHLGNGRWKFYKGPLVVARGHACSGMYRTHVRTCKKKFNAVKVFKKTPLLRVDINGVAAKRVEFSRLDSDLNEEVTFDEKYHDAGKNDEVKDREGLEQGEQYPLLEIVETLERRYIEEHQTVSFGNIWASDEENPRNWTKDIQSEINFSRMKDIDFDEIFSVLVKVMKKVWPDVGLTSVNSKYKVELKISSLSGLEEEIVGCQHPQVQPMLFVKAH